MHFVLSIEKVKYNLFLGGTWDEKCIQIWAVQKSDGAYLDKPVRQGWWQPFTCHHAELHVSNSEVYGLYWVESVDSISVLQREVIWRDLVTQRTLGGKISKWVYVWEHRRKLSKLQKWILLHPIEMLLHGKKMCSLQINCSALRACVWIFAHTNKALLAFCIDWV